MSKSIDVKQDHVTEPNFNTLLLQAHNKYRSMHSAPNLTYSKEISTFSQTWAENLAAKDQMFHSKKEGFGENIFLKSSNKQSFLVEPNEPADFWYNEIKDYTHFGKESPTDVDYIVKIGHFTQLVWKGSKQMGIGAAKSPKSGTIYVVCNYKPQGNITSKFKDNVLPVKK